MKRTLLSVKRIRPSTTKDDRSSKQMFESDRGRVLFSSPLRRMQSKAQVFSLESNAAVRSRLTHSLEVAHIGRYIAQQLQKVALANGDKESQELYLEIEPIVETACLLHDIGNPPFGHLGEDAIKEWFKKSSSKLFNVATEKHINIESPVYLDIANFDGNPQGLRIAMTLQGIPGKNGYNLTSAQLGAIVKYPKSSSDKNEKYKKIGVFQNEFKEIKSVWKEMGLEWGNRHPLVLLMEASDDIAYSLSDIEDGIEKGIISEEKVIDHLKENFINFDAELKKHLPYTRTDKNGMVIGDYVKFRTGMINSLTKHVAEEFYKNRENLDEKYSKGILDSNNNNDFSKSLKIINDFCKKNLYRSPEAEDIEIAGYNIVYGLLEKFSILLSLTESEFQDLIDGQSKGHNLEKRMLGRLPSRLIDHYKFSKDKDLSNEWYYRCFILIDYISGMTDDYALKLYRLLNGIEVKVV